MSKLSDVFVRAKELLEIPGAWITRKVFDNDGGGHCLSKTAPTAKKYCAYGAVYKAQYELGTLPEGASHHGGLALGGCLETALLEQAFHEMPDHNRYINAADYNNRNPAGLEGVKRMFCKAIELAIEKEG